MSEAKWKMPLSIQHDRGMVIWDSDNITVVSHAVTEDDAREIVRRCNAHDDLLAACEALLATLNHMNQIESWCDSTITFTEMDRAAQAIAKAKGGQP